MKKKYLLPAVFIAASIICAVVPIVTSFIDKVEEATKNILAICGWTTSPTFALIAIILIVFSPRKSKRYFDFLKDDEFDETEYSTNKAQQK